MDDHIKLVDEHVKFQQEHKLLLTAQVILTERVDKLAENVEKMRVEFAEAHKHSDERLNALITVVDGIVRKRG